MLRHIRPPVVVLATLVFGAGTGFAQDPALDAKVGAFTTDFFRSAGMPVPDDLRIERQLVDLGGSATPEGLVVLRSSMACGTMGCSAFILDLEGAAARSIGDFIATGFSPLDSRTNGWRDVGMGPAVLQFDNGAYQVVR